MTQKTFFTREAIVEAAFSLTREEGWPAVTARAIARRLGSSTMPIYSSMKSMEDIEQEVRRRAETLLLEFQGRDYGGAGSLNMAVGYVTFARDERNLFRFLYIDRPLQDRRGTGDHPLTTVQQFMEGGTRPVALADQVPTAMEDPRILKSWIFTHGLASLVSSGVLELADARIRSLLMEAGAAFFGEVPTARPPRKEK